MQFLPRLYDKKRFNSPHPYMRAAVDLGLTQGVPSEVKCLRLLVFLTLNQLKEKIQVEKEEGKNQAKYFFSSFCLLHVTLNINHELFLA